jgi:hypothetical protein
MAAKTKIIDINVSDFFMPISQSPLVTALRWLFWVPGFEPAIVSKFKGLKPQQKILVRYEL